MQPKEVHDRPPAKAADIAHHHRHLCCHLHHLMLLFPFDPQAAPFHFNFTPHHQCQSPTEAPIQVPISFNNSRKNQKKVLPAEDFQRKYQGDGVNH